MSGKEIMLSNRMLSTYINTLVRNGFVVEELIEETDMEKARGIQRMILAERHACCQRLLPSRQGNGRFARGSIPFMRHS